MEFTSSVIELDKVLNKLAKHIPKRPIVPILQNFLFDFREDGVYIIASNIQFEIAIRLDIYRQKVKTGKVCVHAKSFRQIITALRKLKEKNVQIVFDDDDECVFITTDTPEVRMSTTNADEYPIFTREFDSDQDVDVSEAFFNAALQAYSFCSTDKMKPAMMGVFVEFLGEGKKNLVATDGYLLIYRQVSDHSDQTCVKGSYIIPSDVFDTIFRVFKANKTFRINFSQQGIVRVIFESVSIVANLIDERFPNWKSVIPYETFNTVEINRNELIKSIKKLIDFSPIRSNEPINLLLNKRTVTFSYNERIVIFNHNDNAISIDVDSNYEIKFVGKYMLKTLQSINTDWVRLCMRDPNQAITVKGISNMGEDPITKNINLVMCVS